jgi:hypothetical protein
VHDLQITSDVSGGLMYMMWCNTTFKKTPIKGKMKSKSNWMSEFLEYKRGAMRGRKGREMKRME